MTISTPADVRAARRRIVSVAWTLLREGYITAEHYLARIDRANATGLDAPYPSLRASRG